MNELLTLLFSVSMAMSDPSKIVQNNMVMGGMFQELQQIQQKVERLEEAKEQDVEQIDDLKHKLEALEAGYEEQIEAKHRLEQQIAEESVHNQQQIMIITQERQQYEKKIDQLSKELDNQRDVNDKMRKNADILNSHVKDKIENDRATRRRRSSKLLFEDAETTGMYGTVDTKPSISGTPRERATLLGTGEQSSGREISGRNLPVIQGSSSTHHQGTPCRKPPMYKLDSKTKFKHWLTAFKNFASAARIPQRDYIDSMLTFLSPQSLRRVEALGLTKADRADVELSLSKITKALSEVSAVSMAKAKLLRMKQKKTQSIAEFATEIMDLASEAYPEANQESLRTEILMDVFLTGMRSEYIALSVLRDRPRSFKQALDSAIELEATIATRGEFTEVQTHKKTEEPILVVQETKDMSTVQCYRCRRTGHYRYQCKTEIQCKQCGSNNHVTDSCRQLVGNSTRNINLKPMKNSFRNDNRGRFNNNNNNNYRNSGRWSNRQNNGWRSNNKWFNRNDRQYNNNAYHGQQKNNSDNFGNRNFDNQNQNNVNSKQSYSNSNNNNSNDRSDVVDSKYLDERKVRLNNILENMEYDQSRQDFQ